MEQVRKAGGQEQEKDRVEPLVVAREIRAGVKVVRVAAGEVASEQVPMDFASAPTAVNEHPISREVPVMIRNVPSAERP